jgi:hypothetical protein
METKLEAMLVKANPAAKLIKRADGKLEAMLDGITVILQPDYEVTPTPPNMNPNTPRLDFIFDNGQLIINYPYGFTQRFKVLFNTP